MLVVGVVYLERSSSMNLYICGSSPTNTFTTLPSGESIIFVGKPWIAYFVKMSLPSSALTLSHGS